jgi:hypothetical protein
MLTTSTLFELQKVERCVLVGIEAASYGGLQKIVGRRH